jgi:hypothetical protein
MDFVDNFLEYTASSEAPKIFRKWVAIGMVASCLGRRVWTTTTDPNAPFHPNLFVLLVGEPGVGKTLPLGTARKLMRQVPGIELGPDQITPESLAEELADMTGKPERNTKDDEEPEDKNAEMALFLNEFGDFVKADSKNFTDHITFLAGLYDCPDFYDKRTKTAGDDLIHKPCINVLAGTQPAWFGEAFTQMSLGQGFPARLFLVYSDERKRKRPFADSANDPELERKLVGALEKRTHISGKMEWSDEAKEVYADEYEKDVEPKPTEPLLASYCERRGFYLAKLTMVAAANLGRDHIEAEDVKQAKSWMLEIEQDMHKALLHAGGNRDRGVENSVIKEIKAKGKGKSCKISHQEICMILARQVDSWRRPQMIRAMEDEGKIVRLAGQENAKNPTYQLGNNAEEA